MKIEALLTLFVRDRINKGGEEERDASSHFQSCGVQFMWEGTWQSGRDYGSPMVQWMDRGSCLQAFTLLTVHLSKTVNRC